MKRRQKITAHDEYAHLKVVAADGDRDTCEWSEAIGKGNEKWKQIVERSRSFDPKERGR